MSDAMQMVSLRLPAEFIAMVDDLAKRQGVDRSRFFRDLIQRVSDAEPAPSTAAHLAAMHREAPPSREEEQPTGLAAGRPTEAQVTAEEPAGLEPKTVAHDLRAVIKRLTTVGVPVVVAGLSPMEAKVLGGLLGEVFAQWQKAIGRGQRSPTSSKPKAKRGKAGPCEHPMSARSKGVCFSCGQSVK